MAAEEIRELRRKERKQFKIDRAQAILDAAVAAEAMLTSGRTPPVPPSSSDASSSTQPQLAPGTKLTPQTFLVRPERPNNRGPPSAAETLAAKKAVEAAKADDEDDFDESLVQDREHLQLSLEEAWFLAWAIGVLRVLDPIRVSGCFHAVASLHDAGSVCRAGNSAALPVLDPTDSTLLV